MGRNKACNSSDGIEILYDFSYIRYDRFGTWPIKTLEYVYGIFIGYSLSIKLMFTYQEVVSYKRCSIFGTIAEEIRHSQLN